MIEDTHTLAAAYALDALDPEERRSFEAHYPSCDTCRGEVDDYRRTAARLGALAPAPLPEDLKARVLDEVDRTPQLPPSVPPRRTGDDGALRWRRPLLAIAAVIACVALAGGLVLWRTDDGDGRGTELAQVLGAPDATAVRLEGDGDATLRVVYSEDVGRAVVVGSDLPNPGDGRAYQLWSIDGDAVRSAGVFVPDPSGDVDQSIDLPAGTVGAWGVTNEPSGGSPAPTTDVLFQGGTA